MQWAPLQLVCTLLLLLLLLVAGTVTSRSAGASGRLLSPPVTLSAPHQKRSPSPMSLLSAGRLPVVVGRQPLPSAAAVTPVLARRGATPPRAAALSDRPSAALSDRPSAAPHSWIPPTNSHPVSAHQPAYVTDFSPHFNSELSPQLSSYLSPQLGSQFSRNYSSLLNYQHHRSSPTHPNPGSQSAVPDYLVNWDHPSLVGAVPKLKQIYKTASAGLSTGQTGQAQEDISDVIKALTQYYLVREALPSSGGAVASSAYEDRCYEACARVDNAHSTSAGPVLGGVKATVTILLWASLAAAAAWVAPNVNTSGLFATRSLTACDVTAHALGIGSCADLGGIYQQLVTGLTNAYARVTGGEYLPADRAAYESEEPDTPASSVWNHSLPSDDAVLLSNSSAEQTALLNSSIGSALQDIDSGRYRTANDNTSAASLLAIRLPRAVQLSKGEGPSEAPSSSNASHESMAHVIKLHLTAWGNLTSQRFRDTAVNRSSERSSVPFGLRSASVNSVMRSPQFSRRSDWDTRAPSDLPSVPAEEFESAKRRRHGSPAHGRGLRRQVGRMWSRMSRMATAVPRMLTESFQKWTHPRNVPQPAHDQQPYSSPEDVRTISARRYDYHASNSWRPGAGDGSTGQERHPGHRRQQPTPHHLSSAGVRRNSACACSGLQRRKGKYESAGNNLGQFLSDSFWIPALGLAYLFGLFRSNGNSGVTITDTDNVSNTNNDQDTLTNTVTITLTNMPTNTNTQTQTSSDTVTTTVTDNSQNTNTGGTNTNTNTNG